MFQFENFRVRTLKAINALNFYITLCMVFLGLVFLEPETNALKVNIIKTADPVYYRMQKKASGSSFGRNV